MIQSISTHKGVYKVNRLMFGVKIAANIFQRFMDQTLENLDGVACILMILWFKDAQWMNRYVVYRLFLTDHD
jgi:hypothetical protein